MRFDCYYYEFIQAYADFVRALTQLTPNTVLFIWTGQCQKALELLKESSYRVQL